jgi:hypothetical protein
MKHVRALIAALAVIAAAGALAATLVATSGAAVKDACRGPGDTVLLNSFNDPNGYFATNFDLNGNGLICVRDD